MKRIPLKGDEYDALTYARRYYNWGRGTIKYWKRSYNKRLRKACKAEMRREVQ